jgi:hypothetical protein
MAQNYFSKTPKFNPAAFSQGVNLGMFGQNKAEPDKDSLLPVLRNTPKQFEIPEGVTPDLAYTLQMLNPSTDPKQAWELDKERIRFIADLQEEQAARRQKFGEESTGKAVLYQALANIGPTIAQAVNPSYLMEAGTRISSAASEAFRSVPAMNVQAPGYNIAQFKYF